MEREENPLEKKFTIFELCFVLKKKVYRRPLVVDNLYEEILTRHLLQDIFQNVVEFSFLFTSQKLPGFCLTWEDIWYWSEGEWRVRGCERFGRELEIATTIEVVEIEGGSRLQEVWGSGRDNRDDGIGESSGWFEATKGLRSWWRRSQRLRW
ncbi:hypothetical protein Adt_41382 [Abeliophyllum distichum]|uniref:Uncharacterized protein n=1 Tax=Abeliophyllum distichum TaxID=126358 RepID=A0ABD1PNP1_9LAMI